MSNQQPCWHGLGIDGAKPCWRPANHPPPHAGMDGEPFDDVTDPGPWGGFNDRCQLGHGWCILPAEHSGWCEVPGGPVDPRNDEVR